MRWQQQGFGVGPAAHLLVRAAVITLCGLTQLSFDSSIDRLRTVVVALLLLLVAALASTRLPGSVPRVVQPFAEVVPAAAILGDPTSAYFRPYLLVPIAVLAVVAGLVWAVSAAVLATLILTGTCALTSSPFLTQAQQQSAYGRVMIWGTVLLAVAGATSWSGRPRPITALPSSDPAYADAHRLLSELHVVARQLSLGLDPQTLAAALVEEVEALVPARSSAVLVRSPGGLFVPLVGELQPAEANAAVHDAWITSQTVRRTVRDKTVIAVPVRMGVRVVALVVIILPRGREVLRGSTLQALQEAVDTSGPRLAAAMLFDDIRQLATVDERLRLAREIHDGIAQDMASVGYQLDDIAGDATGDVAERIAELRRHLGTMVTELRLSIFDLRAGVDDVVGLGTAVSEYAKRVGAQSGLTVNLSLNEGSARLPTAVEVELLRILQEAVTNVRRHAEASNLWIDLDVQPPSARLRVADDGRGLQPGRMDSVGLVGMRERASRIGATMRLSASDHGGTEVEVAIGRVRSDDGP